MNQNLQNRLITLGIVVVMIILLIMFSRQPSGIDRIEDQINQLKQNTLKQERIIKYKDSLLNHNEVEKKVFRDSIKLLKADKVQLKQDIKIEKEKFKDISGRYKKLSNDSLAKVINNI